jgi:hypothetical protein
MSREFRRSPGKLQSVNATGKFEADCRGLALSPDFGGNKLLEGIDNVKEINYSQ